MVMKINCDVDYSLVITIEYDDGTSKTSLVSVGDYVEVWHNYNGVRRKVTGTVSSIHANPESTQTSRKDWYFIVHTDDITCPTAVKILVSNLLDVEVLHMKRQVNAINSPNNAMRVTDIRIKGGYLQVSNNNGASWKTISEPIEDSDLPEADLHQRIEDLVNGEHADSEELVTAILNLVKEELRKHHHCCCEDDGE